MGAPSSTTVATAAPGQQRRRRWRALPWAVLVLWVAVVALAGPLAGKLADVQQNRAVDYLPVSADSTQVAKVQDALPGGEATDLVVVYHRDGGLTAADRSKARTQTAEIARAHELTRPPTGIPSKDGTTLMYAVSSTQPGQDDAARNAFVDDVRKVTSGGGLTAEVGGAGALNTDMKEVYSSLDGPLLYTTVAVVAVLLILIYRSPLLWLLPLVVAGVADVTAMGVVYGLHKSFDITVTGQSQGVMTILAPRSPRACSRCSARSRPSSRRTTGTARTRWAGRCSSSPRSGWCCGGWRR